MSGKTLACYVGLEGASKHCCHVNDQDDRTYVHCSVFRKHSIKVTKEFQELIGDLDNVSEETKRYMKCLYFG